MALSDAERKYQREYKRKKRAENPGKEAEYQRQYRLNNPGLAYQYQKQYIAKNPEKAKESSRRYGRKYRASNSDKLKEKNRQYYEDNWEQVNERMRQYDATNSDRHRKNYLKREYGMTLAEFNERLLTQGGMCAICGDSPATDIDHDHSTGKIRNLLCSQCNRAIGQLRESVRILQNAIDYLSKHGAVEKEPSKPKSETVDQCVQASDQLSLFGDC